MKNGYSILTRRMQGMDMRVWLTMVCLVLVSGTILAFKFSGRKECRMFQIAVTEAHATGNEKFYPKDTVAFAVKEEGTVRWDFGDSFSAEGKHVKHQYVTDGEYTVTAMLDGQCVQKTIVTVNKVFVDLSKLDEEDPIWAPPTITVGKKAAFTYQGGRKITSFEWSIVSSQVYPLQHTKIVSYNFITAGEQTIRLTVNDGKERTYNKTITVLADAKPIEVNRPMPKPVRMPNNPNPQKDRNSPTKDVGAMNEVPVTPINIPPVITKKTAAEISDGDLKSIFEGVSAGTRQAQELNKYLCNGGATRVIAGGKEETVTGICSKVAGKKNTLKGFLVIRDGNDCISLIKLEYKKSFWEKIF